MVIYEIESEKLAELLEAAYQKAKANYVEVIKAYLEQENRYQKLLNENRASIEKILPNLKRLAKKLGLSDEFEIEDKYWDYEPYQEFLLVIPVKLYEYLYLVKPRWWKEIHCRVGEVWDEETLRHGQFITPWVDMEKPKTPSQTEMVELGRLLELIKLEISYGHSDCYISDRVAKKIGYKAKSSGDLFDFR